MKKYELMEWIESIVYAIGAVIVIGIISLIFFSFYYECQFSKQPSFELKAILQSKDYSPSTRSCHTAMAFTGKGMTPVIHSSGHSEIYTTIWDCGSYGNLVSNKQEVFRYAKPQSILYLKTYHNETRIVGIKYQ